MMMRRIGMLACAVAVAFAGTAFAQDTISGTVKHVDDTGRIIELTDGRIVHLSYDGEDDRAVFVGGRAVLVTDLRPGAAVVVPARPITVSSVQTTTPAPPRASVATTEGTVVRVDPGTETIVLSDGRVIQTSASTVILVADRPVEVAMIQPGQAVVIRDGGADPSALARETRVMRTARVLLVRYPQAP